ncbi:MAG: hypothetical protein RL095_907 [Verrucomicrobiota bacterium]|jgi:polyphosphate kinase
MKPRYINRELSWLEFNARVMGEAARSDMPLLERFRFLCIVSSNLDEFFMVRIASLLRCQRDKLPLGCPSGAAPDEVLRKALARVRKMLKQQHEILHDKILPGLNKAGIELVFMEKLSTADISSVESFFDHEIFPVLTPIKAADGMIVHNFSNLGHYVAFLLRDPVAPEETLLAVVQVPHVLNRLVPLPAGEGERRFTFLGNLIKIFAGRLFPGMEVLEHTSFRLSKDADMAVDEDEDRDFISAMQEVISDRERGYPVRLEILEGTPVLAERLRQHLGVAKELVFPVAGPIDLKTLMHLASLPGHDRLRFPAWTPQPAADLGDSQDLFAAIRQGDVLLHHPYEAFEPVVRLVEQAAADPEVLAIKMTLYRTSGNSPIVAALLRAAQARKQVVVLVELKARFDEVQNIRWARELEEAGATVICGVAQLKVHCKFLMVIRREADRIRRYLHLGTGNYNERTATLYTDLGLMTCREDLADEASLFFNSLTGYSRVPQLQRLAMAPFSLKSKVLALIDRERQLAVRGAPAAIDAKMNALADPEVIAALYKASQAGVQIRLNVRGVCMLLPGVKGLSENIRVVSIIGRFLEHSRIYWFRNGGDPQVFLSSADWMPRNLERRIELMFPVLADNLRERLRSQLDRFFADNCHSHELENDGSWLRLKPAERSACHSCQDEFMRLARSAALARGPALGDELPVRRMPKRKGKD